MKTLPQYKLRNYTKSHTQKKNVSRRYNFSSSGTKSKHRVESIGSIGKKMVIMENAENTSIQSKTIAL